MYTIYGHEGPTNCAEFSPLGDFILTGGQDANIVIWKSNLNERCTEVLHGISAAKVDTEIFVTDKPLVKKLPTETKPRFQITKKENKQPNQQNKPGTSVVADPSKAMGKPPLANGGE